jgi:hypothetical protein
VLSLVDIVFTLLDLLEMFLYLEFAFLLLLGHELLGLDSEHPHLFRDPLGHSVVDHLLDAFPQVEGELIKILGRLLTLRSEVQLDGADSSLGNLSLLVSLNTTAGSGSAYSLWTAVPDGAAVLLLGRCLHINLSFTLLVLYNLIDPFGNKHTEGIHISQFLWTQSVVGSLH